VENSNSFQRPVDLEPGDLIYITAPAKAIDASYVQNAKVFFENAGFQVEIGQHCTDQHHYFSGTDAQRLQDFQYGIDHPEIKAIVCARGGYGCVRITDSINWAGMLREPKWLVGFSDVTVFHQKLQRFGIQSLHASMPLNFNENTPQALASLLAALTGKNRNVSFEAHPKNKLGEASGTLLGGNLSILFSLIGTDDQPDYTDSILFIEDLSEQLYHIDRIFHSLRKSGVLDKIKGLIVGGMTDIKDTAQPFGVPLEDIVLSHFAYRKIPICFQFPAGHINDNRALALGEQVTLQVAQNNCQLIFLKA
jgi:muramoyltetrapeptide carboxypeptidase